jgi:hypothetical protein
MGETGGNPATPPPAQTVAYLAEADKYFGPLPSRLPGLLQPLMRSCIGFSGPPSTLVAWSQAHWSHLALRSSSCPTSYTTWGCGHGGTRKSSTSLKGRCAVVQAGVRLLTDAMAAGCTDHVWSLRKGWLFWVPPYCACGRVSLYLRALQRVETSRMTMVCVDLYKMVRVVESTRP